MKKGVEKVEMEEASQPKQVHSHEPHSSERCEVSVLGRQSTPLSP